MNIDYVVFILALASLFGYYLSIARYLDTSKKWIVRLHLIYSAGTFVFFYGLLFGWYGRTSIITGVILPLIGYSLFLGAIWLMLHREKKKAQ